MQILMHVNIGHDPAAVRIILQIVDYTVHLIHLAFFVLMLHAELIAVSLSDRAVLICPCVPDVRIQVMHIVGLFLPDPQKFIKRTFQCRSSKRQCRKFFSQIVTVDHAEFLDRVRRLIRVLPDRTHLFSFCAHSVIQNISAHSLKYFICIAHAISSCLFYPVFSFQV